MLYYFMNKLKIYNIDCMITVQMNKKYIQIAKADIKAEAIGTTIIDLCSKYSFK